MSAAGATRDAVHVRVRVADAELAVACVGPPDAPVVMVLPGGPGESHDYLRPPLDLLAGPARRVAYLDPRGCGASTFAGPRAALSEAALVADIAAVRAQLGAARVDVLGFSWGALLALRFALSHPHEVGRLVLLSPPPLDAEGRAAMGARFATARARPAVAAVLRAAEALGDRARAEFVCRVAAALFDPHRALEARPASHHPAIAAALDGVPDVRALAADLARPHGLDALVVHGLDDPMPCTSAEQLAAALGARIVAIPRCGHAPFLDAPDALAQTVNAFLALPETRA